MLDLGGFVKRHRQEQGMTQQQLADKAGVGLNFVYQLEKNKPTVQLDLTQNVLLALGFEFSVQPASAVPGWMNDLEERPKRELPW